jgi:aspartate carbamoyltransferase regulatory subunit
MKEFQVGDIVKIKNIDIYKKDIDKKFYGCPKILIGIVTISFSSEKVAVEFPHNNRIKNTYFVLPTTEISQATEEECQQFHAHELASKL